MKACVESTRPRCDIAKKIVNVLVKNGPMKTRHNHDRTRCGSCLGLAARGCRWIVATMNLIIPRKLWIGNARDCRDAKSVLDADIACVVDLAAEEPPAQLPRELMSLRFPLKDGSGNSATSLRMAVTTLAALMRNDIPVLLCCGGGMSRSPAIAAFALSLLGEKGSTQWLLEISSVKPVDVSPALWNDLQHVIGDR